MRWLLLIFSSLSAWSSPSHALDEKEFRESLSRIAQQQELTDTRIQALGIKGRSSDRTRREETSDSEKMPPLFQVHANPDRLHAPSGSFVFGTLYNRVVLGSEVVQTVIQVNENQGIFSSLRVTGKARPSGVEDRVALELDRLILKSGRTISIRAIGQDEEGASGIVAQVLTSKSIAVAGSVLGSFLSGAASLLQTATPSGFGFSQVERSPGNALLQGASQVAADQSRAALHEATKERPVLILEAGTPVTLFFEEEVRF